MQHDQNFSDFELARIFLDPSRLFVGTDYLAVIGLWGKAEGTIRNKKSAGTLPKFENFGELGGPAIYKLSEVLNYVDNLKAKLSPSPSQSKPTPPLAAETKRQRGRPTKLSLAAAKNGGEK